MTEPRRLLIVDDDPDFLVSMKFTLKQDYGVTTARTINEAIAILRERDVDLVLLDVSLGEENGLEGIEKIHSVHPSVGIAMLSGEREVQTVVKAIRAGAVDYLTKPVGMDQITEVVEKAVSARTLQEKCEALLLSQRNGKNGTTIIHNSDVMKDLMHQAHQFKGHNANLLIMGETGVGKELLARFVHNNENNSRRPFIAVNCAAIPAHLLEAELFGHEAGAFTGANRRRIGKFELADGGDIFLDEVSTMQLDLQVKLLRVLQEKEFCRLGSNSPIKANFRVISACNQSLEDMMEKGEFRADLYHRLRVLQLTMPPLRDRAEDIPLLVEYFLKKFASNGEIKKFTDSAMAKLMEYGWPGNVRELANVVQSLVIMTQSNVIDETAFPEWVMNGYKNVRVKMSDSIVNRIKPMETVNKELPLKDYIQYAERSYIEQALKDSEGDKSRAADSLGIGRSTLYIKMKDLGMLR